MLEKLTGIIPEADDRYLQRLIETEDEVRALWNEFQAESREDSHFYIERLDVKEELAVLTERRELRFFPIPEWIIAVAIILVLGVLSYFFPMRAEMEITPAKDSIVLKK